MSDIGFRARRRLPALTAAALAAVALAGCGGTAATGTASTGNKATVDRAFIGTVGAWCSHTVARYRAAEGSFPARDFDPLPPTPASCRRPAIPCLGTPCP